MTFPRTLVCLGLMALLPFLAIGCGKSQQELARDARDAKVIAEVKRLGGYVYQVEAGHAAAAWLYPGAVSGVSFTHCDLSETSLADILPPDTIERVEIVQSRLGDHHARQLASLPNLKRLKLYDTDITDEGVRLLCQLPRLEYLSLERCQITDAAAAHLVQAKSLKYVNLQTTHITAAGIDALAPQLIVDSGNWSTVPSEEVRQAMVRLSQMGLFLHDNLCQVRDEGKPLRFGVTWDARWNHDPRAMQHLQTLSQAGLLRITIIPTAFPALPEGPVDSIAELRFVTPFIIDSTYCATHAEELSSLSQLRSVEKLIVDTKNDVGPLLPELLGLKGLQKVRLFHQKIDPERWRLLTGELELQQIEFIECTFERIEAFSPIPIDSAGIQFKSCPAEQTTELLRLAP